MKSMSGSVKLWMILLAAVFAGWLVFKIVGAIIGGIFALIMPVLVIGVIAYALYSLVGRKALGGGRRRTLP